MSQTSIRIVAACLAASGISACSTSPSPPIVPNSATTRIVNLVAADGGGRGQITLQEASGGSTLTVQAIGLSPGNHGLHLHDKGLCEGPAFASAGGHWNPTGRKHGQDNPAGAHLGDLPNLQIDASGSGTASFTLAPGSADADGTALVVHAKADDYRTDPSGNSGDRIACAVIAAPR
jgi:Cu-Zn family superoxide dismutase